MTNKINIFCLVGAHNPDSKWQLDHSDYCADYVCHCRDCQKLVMRSSVLSQLRADLQKLNKIRLRRRRDSFAAALPFFTTKLAVFNMETSALVGHYEAGSVIYKKDLRKLHDSYVVVSARFLGINYQKRLSGVSLFENLYAYFDMYPDSEYYTL